MLVQVGPVVFCLCSYKEKQVTPNEMLVLEGYTVNYYTPETENSLQEISGSGEAAFQVY